MHNTKYIKHTPYKYKWIIYCLSFGLILFSVSLIGIVYTNLSQLKWAIAISSIGVLASITIALKTRTVRKISNRLDNFIKSNNLFQYTTNTNGKIIIEYYPTIEFKMNNNEMWFRFRLDGSHIGQKLRNLEQALADCFSTLCLEILEERGYITYILESTKPEQETIHSLDDLLLLEEGYIKIGNITIPWKKVPHMLIAGTTQSGKTTLSQYIMFLLRKQNVRVIYLDPKNDLYMRRFCNTYDIKYYSNLEEIENTIIEIEEEMRLRQIDLDNMDLKEAEFNPIYIFFDELIAYSALVSDKKYKSVLAIISSIVTQGAGKRTYFGAILQRGDTQYLPGSIRSNLLTKILMGKSDETSYAMLFPDISYMPNLRTEKGSGLIYRTGIDTRPKEILVPHLVKK